ncbi:hypothetical protein F5Y17DRAFT_391028 [Xylariaceae sp. FL0594]|nr:hypothetical protein F5Y17DRAFT_391028 [Xylariaceae sp. FL0594]
MGHAVGQVSRARAPRLYHKKSRTGCLRCKQRRVKCDELRPCGGCSRHMVECVYQTQLQNSTSTSSGRTESHPRTESVIDGKPLLEPSINLKSPHSADVTGTLAHSPTRPCLIPSPAPLSRSPHTPAYLGDGDSDELPEGAWRRLWELRLLHNSQTRMKQPFPEPQDPELLKMWTEDVPNMAISFAQNQGRCGLLYIEMAHSALHMWTSSKDKLERDALIKLQQTYYLMCSRQQRRDIDEIPRASSQLLDYICFTALRIVAHSLALVQTLSLDPWEPPLQWLYLGNGAGSVFQRARDKLKAFEHDSVIGKFVNTPPIMRTATDTILTDHTPLAWLLDHPSHPSSVEAQKDQELNDQEVRTVYEQALGYTCSVVNAIARKESQTAIAGRLGGFAVWVPIKFSKFVEERRPRALVILAHFMSLWIDMEDVWLIGKAGEWQIRCIYKNLPVEWTCKLDGLFAKFKRQGGR